MSNSGRGAPCNGNALPSRGYNRAGNYYYSAPPNGANYYYRNSDGGYYYNNSNGSEYYNAPTGDGFYKPSGSGSYEFRGPPAGSSGGSGGSSQTGGNSSPKWQTATVLRQDFWKKTG